MKAKAIASTVSPKNQTTVPQEVRKVLKIANGDGLQWILKEDEVIVKKISKMDLEWAKSVGMTLQEWNSKEDDEAFDGL